MFSFIVIGRVQEKLFRYKSFSTKFFKPTTLTMFRHQCSRHVRIWTNVKFCPSEQIFYSVTALSPMGCPECCQARGWAYLVSISVNVKWRSFEFCLRANVNKMNWQWSLDDKGHHWTSEQTSPAEPLAGRPILTYAWDTHPVACVRQHHICLFLKQIRAATQHTGDARRQQCNASAQEAYRFLLWDVSSSLLKLTEK